MNKKQLKTLLFYALIGKIFTYILLSFITIIFILSICEYCLAG